MVPDLKGEHRRGGLLSKLINEIDKNAKKMKNPGTGSELGSGNMIEQGGKKSANGGSTPKNKYGE